MPTLSAPLAANYRGSTGFGEPALRSLLGKIGEQDVADVMVRSQKPVAHRIAGTPPTCTCDSCPRSFQAFVRAIQREAVVHDRAYLYGGSHGGFLTGHLLAQHPVWIGAAKGNRAFADLPRAGSGGYLRTPFARVRSATRSSTSQVRGPGPWAGSKTPSWDLGPWAGSKTLTWAWALDPCLRAASATGPVVAPLSAYSFVSSFFSDTRAGRRPRHAGVRHSRLGVCRVRPR